MRKGKILVFSLVILIILSLGGGSLLSQEKVTLRILGIGGWYPSELAIKLAPQFNKYAEENLGYSAEILADYAPFTALYEKAASALAAHSDAYDIIISDSQWLGAFSTGGHIIQLNDIIESDSGFKAAVEGMYPEHRASYMTYPDGSDQYWGLPQEGDDLVLYVRKDLLEDPTERANFKEKYGFDLPQTYEEFKNMDWETFEKVLEFFTRPEENFYGLAAEYSKEYDYISDHVMSFIWTWGGDIIDWKTFKVDGVINAPEAVEALEYYGSLLRFQPPGAVTYGIDQCVNAIAQSQVFSTLTWAAVGSPIFDPKLSKVYDKVMTVMPPGKKDENGNLHRIYCLGGQPWVISNYSKHQKEAIDFLKWWYTEDAQWSFAREGGNPVIRKIVDTEEFKNLNPWNRAYVDMIPGGRDFWHLPCYSELLLIQQEEWTAYASAYAAGELEDTRSAAQKTMDNIAQRQEQVLRDWGFLE